MIFKFTYINEILRFAFLWFRCYRTVFRQEARSKLRLSATLNADENSERTGFCLGNQRKNFPKNPIDNPENSLRLLHQ